ncbi:hypothetical protein BGX12_11068 [Fibrobacter sp. UWR4]|nr:hypothetical protein BGX12_11068 [Fibrobacter sp. UWR4]PZW71877.1 hypothetical protein C8E88_100969 [Fibrobacter sp. UWR1]
MAHTLEGDIFWIIKKLFKLLFFLILFPFKIFSRKKETSHCEEGAIQENDD